MRKRRWSKRSRSRSRCRHNTRRQAPSSTSASCARLVQVCSGQPHFLATRGEAPGEGQRLRRNQHNRERRGAHHEQPQALYRQGRRSRGPSVPATRQGSSWTASGSHCHRETRGTRDRAPTPRRSPRPPGAGARRDKIRRRRAHRSTPLSYLTESNFPRCPRRLRARASATRRRHRRREGQRARRTSERVAWSQYQCSPGGVPLTQTGYVAFCLRRPAVPDWRPSKGPKREFAPPETVPCTPTSPVVGLSRRYGDSRFVVAEQGFEPRPKAPKALFWIHKPRLPRSVRPGKSTARLR